MVAWHHTVNVDLAMSAHIPVTACNGVKRRECGFRWGEPPVDDTVYYRVPGSAPTSVRRSRCSSVRSASGQGSKSGSRELRLAGPAMPPRESSARRTDEAPRLLRQACHDMRQPVAGVLRLAAVALAQPGVPDAARSCLEQIVTQTVSLTELFHQWLYAAEPEKATALPADLTRLAAEASAAERVTYHGKVEFLSPPEPVLIRVTPADARRIISNLLGNATRAAGPGGMVTVEVVTDGTFAEVTVEDTGPGFGKIPKGEGLGLSIVAQSLARCGGRLEYGRGRGGGVRASLRLPLAAA